MAKFDFTASAVPPAEPEAAPPVNSFRAMIAARRAAPSLADQAVAVSASLGGVPVFPCAADKRPCTAHGFKDASPDPAQIRAMFARPGCAMIGMPTGAASGFTVVDVDIKNGAQGDVWLTANAERLPATRTSLTRSGGSHWWFRAVDGLRNSASKIAPGVDIRGDGGYIVVPPSPGYEWRRDAEAAEMPAWLVDLCRPAELVPRPATLAADRPVALDCTDGTPWVRGALAKACDAIRCAADGQKHNTINTEAHGIGGYVPHALPEGEAWAALQAAVDAIKPRCQDQRAAQRTLERGFAEGKMHPRDVPADSAVFQSGVTAEDAELHERQFGPMLAAVRRKNSAPLPVSPGLMDVGGAMQMFIEHCERTSVSPQPFLSLASAICLVGTLAGRRYRTQTDLRTNVYAVGVVDSGGGKDHARKRIKACLAEAGLTQYLGGEKIASGQAMFTALARHPALLFQIDEFGDFLSGIVAAKDAHRKDIAANLKILYSSASTYMCGTEYADDKARPKADIHQPHACLYATTTPGQLWSAIASSSLHDGLMARMLLFVTPCNYPDQASAMIEPIPEPLLAALKEIARGAADPETGEVGGGNLGSLMSASAAPQPYTVRNTPAAEAAFLALRAEQTARLRKHEGTYVTAIVARLAENSIKLALIRAVSRRPSAPSIEADDVAWGRAVSMHCVETMLREASANVADTEFGKRLALIRAIIRKHGPITENAMIRKGSSALSPKERADAIETLVKGGEVIAIQHPGGDRKGQPTIKYAFVVAE